MNRGPSRFAGACLRAFSPDAAVHPRTPIQPGPEVKSLDVESVSEFIWSADYRVHYVRIRLRDTSGGPFTISRINLEFLGDGVEDATRTFMDIPSYTILRDGMIELRDLKIADELHQLDSAKSVIATVIYTRPGEAGTAIGEGAVPTCTLRLSISGPARIAVGESGQMSVIPKISLPCKNSALSGCWQRLTNL